jgi:hypothetical protein
LRPAQRDDFTESTERQEWERRMNRNLLRNEERPAGDENPMPAQRS